MSTTYFSGDLGTYHIKTTTDGSLTLYSEAFEENCHSLHGAYSETLVHSYEGARVEAVYEKERLVHILEVGFGSGMGLRATFRQLFSLPYRGESRFISTEIDEKLIQWVRREHPDHVLLSRLKKSEYFEIPCYEAFFEGHQLVVLVGDAAANLALLAEKRPKSFEAIYQDPFSPKRCPSLWTPQFFSTLKELATPDAWLSTYSASTSIRRAMVSAGWKVHPGPPFAQKRASTRACASGEGDAIMMQKYAKA